MCYQLLSGFLPFDDTRNRSSPSLSLVWRAILTEEVSFSKSAWQNVSQVAKDFVKTLLNKDPLKRISAKQALDHPWLQSSFHKNNTRTLDSTVVQRIQVRSIRFFVKLFFTKAHVNHHLAFLTSFRDFHNLIYCGELYWNLSLQNSSSLDRPHYLILQLEGVLRWALLVLIQHSLPQKILPLAKTQPMVAWSSQ